MMTRKDYWMIAEILKENHPSHDYKVNPVEMWDNICSAFCKQLKIQNEKFDVAKFVDASTPIVEQE